MKARRSGGMGMRWMMRVAALSLMAGPVIAAEPAWKPEKTVELIAPAAAGGGTDKMARLIQKIWQERQVLAVPIAVVNKPGGGGALSLAYLKQHGGDAHYLQAASALLLTNHIVGRASLPYTDFTPIALMNSEYVVLAVKADSSLRSLVDIVARMRQDPGAVSIAVGMSLGGANHIAAAALARAAGAEARRMKTVVFGSAAESAVATLGGHVDVVAASASLILPHYRAGALRILGISGPRRASGALAAIPTLREQGVDATVDNFRLMIAPASIGPAQATFWDEAMGKLAQAEEWKKDLEMNSWENTYMNGRDTRKYLDQQYAQFRSALIDIGLAK